MPEDVIRPECRAAVHIGRNRRVQHTFIRESQRPVTTPHEQRGGRHREHRHRAADVRSCLAEAGHREHREPGEPGYQKADRRAQQCTARVRPLDQPGERRRFRDSLAKLPDPQPAPLRERQNAKERTAEKRISQEDDVVRLIQLGVGHNEQQQLGEIDRHDRFMMLEANTEQPVMEVTPVGAKGRLARHQAPHHHLRRVEDGNAEQENRQGCTDGCAALLRGEDGEATDRIAEQLAARVPHEHRSRMGIEAQEAQRRPGETETKPGQRVLPGNE